LGNIDHSKCKQDRRTQQRVDGADNQAALYQTETGLWIHGVFAGHSQPTTGNLILSVAWNLAMALCAPAGQALDFQFWPAVMVWVVLGLMSMLRDPVDAPVPAGTYADVVGAVRMPWWAVRWPMRLRKR
jgi:hypothetical protein